MRTTAITAIVAISIGIGLLILPIIIAQESDPPEGVNYQLKKDWDEDIFCKALELVIPEYALSFYQIDGNYYYRPDGILWNLEWEEKEGPLRVPAHDYELIVLGD